MVQLRKTGHGRDKIREAGLVYSSVAEYLPSMKRLWTRTSSTKRRRGKKIGAGFVEEKSKRIQEKKMAKNIPIQVTVTTHKSKNTSKRM